MKVTSTFNIAAWMETGFALLVHFILSIVRIFLCKTNCELVVDDENCEVVSIKDKSLDTQDYENCFRNQSTVPFSCERLERFCKKDLSRRWRSLCAF
jgi:hypothetical protein